MLVSSPYPTYVYYIDSYNDELLEALYEGRHLVLNHPPTDTMLHEDVDGTLPLDVLPIERGRGDEGCLKCITLVLDEGTECL